MIGVEVDMIARLVVIIIKRRKVLMVVVAVPAIFAGDRFGLSEVED